jgi:hypothetical protein
MKILMGRDVLNGIGFWVGGSTEVGGNNAIEVGGTNGVIGSAVGTPLVAIGVRLGGGVLVGTSVNAVCCSGAPDKLQAVAESARTMSSRLIQTKRPVEWLITNPSLILFAGYAPDYNSY